MDRSGQPLRAEDFDDLRLLFGPEVARLDQRLEWSVNAPVTALQAYPAAAVRQIVLNLLLNAAAASGFGGKVALSVTTTGASLDLRIVDSGQGMTEAAQQRLLTDDPVQPGGGVGLRLVRDLVAQNGGYVTYARLMNSTEITVILPERGHPC